MPVVFAVACVLISLFFSESHWLLVGSACVRVHISVCVYLFAYLFAKSHWLPVASVCACVCVTIACVYVKLCVCGILPVACDPRVCMFVYFCVHIC